MTGLDTDGFILSEVSQDNILPEYQRIIDASIAALKTTLPGIVHSVYVYGSVARGNATKGKSDLDLLVVFKRKLTQQEQETLKGLQESLSHEHKALVREVGIADATCTYDEMLDPSNKYGWGAYLKILCVCVDGEDLTKRFDNFKISPDIAIGFNGDVGNSIQNAIQKITDATTDEEAGKAAATVARKIIRTCYSMVMTRAQVWTTKLNEQADLCTRYFPEKAALIGTLQHWIESPPSNREAMLKVLREDCRWVVGNFEVEAKKYPPLTGLVLLIGPPAAGKSTFAKNLLEQQGLDKEAYISNDVIAKDLFGVTVDRGDKDGAIFAEQDKRIADRLKNGLVAIVDATNVKLEARKRLIAIAEQHNQPVTAFCFHRDLATLLKQNQMREVKVPEEMVREYAALMQDVTEKRLQSEGVGTVFEVPHKGDSVSDNIGLARGTVKLVPYDPSWQSRFEAETKLLQQKLGIGAEQIQHVGSTAIPGILAKPIIDIAIMVDSLAVVDEWVQPLAELGYWNKGLQPDMPERRFFAKGPEEKRTVYLHLVTREEYQRLTTFRDALLANPELAQEYSQLKLAAGHADNRAEYTHQKNDFIQRVLAATQP